jgi:PAS domain S-box-containing protein
MTDKPTQEKWELRLQELAPTQAPRGHEDAATFDPQHLMGALLDNLDVGVFMVEAPSGKPLLVNRRAIELLGRGIIDGADKDNLATSYNAYQIGTQNHYPEDRMPVVLGMQGQRTTVDDMVVVTPSGERVFLEVFGSPVRDQKGKIVASLASFSDITQRRQSEEILRKSEEKYRTLFETMSQGVVYQDAMGRIISANPAAERLLGLTLDQMQARSSLDPRWRAIRENGSDFPGEAHPSMVALKTGQEVKTVVMGVFNPQVNAYRWIDTHAVPLFRPGEDTPHQVYTTFSDITARKQAEEGLRQSERKYRSLTNNINVGIYRNAVGPNGRFIEANTAIVKMFGFESKAAFLNTRVADLYLNPADRIAFTAKLLNANEVKNAELRLRKRDGTGFVGSVSAVVVRDEDGSAIYSDGIVEDITGRKRFDEALRKSEEYLRNIYNTAPVAFVIWDADTRVVEWNKKAEDLFGWPKQEVEGKSFFEFLIPESDRPVVEDIVANLLNGRLPSHAVNRNSTKGGGTIICEWNNSLLHDNNGAIVGAISCGLDITARMQTERELRESEAKYRNLYGNAQVGLARTRISDGKVLACNRKMAQIFKYDHPEEFIAEYVFDANYVDPGLRKRLLAAVRKTGFVSNIEAEFYAKDRTKIWARFDTRTFPEKGFMEDVVTDISKRKWAEEAVRKSEAKYRSMMESMVDPIYICSPGFTIEYMNPAMIQRLGRDATGDTCYRTIHGKDQRCASCVFEMVARGDTVERNIQSSFDNRTYRMTNMPIQNDDGTVSKMTILRDISDYLSAVEEKEVARARLVQAQKMESIGNLAGGIAHDFNNILTSIIGYTELALADTARGSTLDNKLQQVYSAGRRARDLVKQILTFARQSDEEVKPIRMDAIIREAMQLLRSSIPTTIEITKRIEKDAVVVGNPTQIHQIMINLGTNAAHAMEKEGGILTVSLEKIEFEKGNGRGDPDLAEGRYVRLRVSDTGMGIAPEHIDAVLDPYFTTKEPGKGTGMGLALVHGIVEGYGGKITVESTLGKGSTFSIYLPSTHQRIPSPRYETADDPTGSERVLFVDDEAVIADMGRLILERLGYSVTSQTRSIEALALFRRQPDAFDLVITDMTMPIMTGDQLALELMQIRPDIPVIICTGFSSKVSEESALALGIKGFLYKPIVKVELAKTVRAVLDAAQYSE